MRKIFSKTTNKKLVWIYIQGITYDPKNAISHIWIENQLCDFLFVTKAAPDCLTEKNAILGTRSSRLYGLGRHAIIKIYS